MSTIRETALAAYGGRLPRGTGAKAKVVLDAVVAREQGIFAELVEAGAALGASRDTVHQILVDAGMHAPDPVNESSDSDSEGRLAALEAKVADALRWARSRGYSG